MEPMNKFLTTSTPDFRSFIDEICGISLGEASAAMLEPQYTAANQIKARLPLASREGLPSLPFLLDSTRLLSELVELWVEHAPTDISQAGGDDCVKVFHDICFELHKRAGECMNTAEQAERPDGKLELQWQQLLHDHQKTPLSSNIFDEEFATSPTDTESLTALPQPGDTRRQTVKVAEPLSLDMAGEGDTTPSSSASVAGDYRRAQAMHRNEIRPALTNSTNSSTLSLGSDVLEEARSRPLPGSRDGQSKSRLLDLMNPSSRTKGKGGRDGGADRERERERHNDANEF